MQQIVEDVLLRQAMPMLLIMEDFHWESPESLAVLQRMTRRIADMPMVMVVSFRHDERPDLPGELPQMRLIRLRRLATDGIAALAESMIGAAGREPAVIELIEKDTEGNAFWPGVCSASSGGGWNVCPAACRSFCVMPPSPGAIWMWN
jgi:predicted ATPase